tara:strand:+ start:1979 stop:3139 length:1161 start_codon:yes stop_codon:yes gene_type:complete
MVRRSFVFVLTLLVCIYFFDISYLFKGVRCTYLRGESSAQIDDYELFFNRSVATKNPFIIPFGKNFNDSIINDSLDFALKKSKSVAFLVVQNDSVRFEKYWKGWDQNKKTNSFSIAKSIMSLLVGCAIDQGVIVSVNQSIFDFLPELKKFNNYDVKIKHLLEMSSGLDWFENYKKPISVTAKAYYGSDLKNLMLGRSFVSEPGKYHDYKSGDTQLLGLILERASGKSVSSFASEFFWSKIGAKNNAMWTLDDSGGIEKTFCCFNSSARDFSKIGLLLLGRGEFLERRVVSDNYINWSLSVPNLIDIKTNKKVDYYSNGWWTANVFNRVVYYARGFNGQYIVTIPSINLVFVRLGFWEDESSVEKNEFKMSDNLLFFTKEIIKEFAY